MPVVRQRDPVRGPHVVHALDQFAEHADEVVDLLRPILADFGLGLDDIAATVGVPGVNVDPTDAASRDYDIEAPGGEVCADGFLDLILGDPAVVTAAAHRWRRRGFGGLLRWAVRQRIDDLSVRSSEPTETTPGLQTARRLVHRLPVPDPKAPRQNVIIQRRVANRIKDPGSQGRHTCHRGTDLQGRSP